MNSYLSRLNPAERRFVVAVAVVFFLVINIFWIWPHFGDWGALHQRLEQAALTLTKREAAIQQKPRIEGEIKKLASEGSYVPPEDQSLQFLRTINDQAAKNGVGFIGSGHSTSSTNLFFVEQSQSITVVSGEKQLVDFLYNLGANNSLIRVREISIRPDPSHQQLNATITFVASYQKTSKPAPARAAKPAAPAAKPASGAPLTRTTPPATTPSSKPAVPKPGLPKPGTPTPATPIKK